MSEQRNMALEDYLRRLGWGLASLPEHDRNDIVAETRAHVLERVERGDSLETVLAAFGAPEIYARTFVDGMELSSALGSEQSVALLDVVLRRAHRSAIAGIAFVVLAFLGACAFAAAYLALLKLLYPAHAGLWISQTQQFIGTIDDPATAHEMLGYWVFPIAVVVCAAAWIMGRLVLLLAVRTLNSGPSKRT
ncbi:MAG: hypothetical protein ABL996_18355 [Micropepsaceae bacterium]